jgi:hypothetical protein
LLGASLEARVPHSARAAAIVRDAQAQAADIPGQALALARLSWPEGERDAEVAALAREKLVHYGDYAFQALFEATDWVPEHYMTDVAAALLEARKLNRSGMPVAYLPALERVVWYGSAGARRLAIRELARNRYLPAMLPAIDAAYEDPALVEPVVALLPQFGHAGARFYLEHVLLEGDTEQQRLAASSLARIGGRALETLRDATLSERREVREAAIGALLPLTGVNDLTTLYEYVATHPGDDPDALQKVRERAVQLEELLDRALERESATPTDY